MPASEPKEAATMNVVQYLSGRAIALDSWLAIFFYLFFFHLLSASSCDCPPELCNLDGDVLMPVFIFISALIQLLCGLP